MTFLEEDIERRADFMIRELDEFCALARDPRTAGLIWNQSIVFGQMQTRLQLILSFLEIQTTVNHGEAI